MASVSEIGSTPERTTTQVAPLGLSVLWLVAGLGASLLSVGGRWSIALLAWVAPILLLRFSRTSPPLIAILGLVAVSFLQMIWMGFEYATDLTSTPTTLALGLILGAILAIPFVVDRLLAGRLNNIGRVLLFPAAWMAMEFAISSILPVGASIGVRAFTQGENVVLMQIISLTGPYAIGFLIAIGATIANHVWENPTRQSLLRWGGGFAASLALILAYGEVRLVFASQPSTASTVKIAGITAPAALRTAAYSLVTPTNAAHAAQTQAAMATPEMKARFAQVDSALFAETQRVARAGAQIVVWSETAAPTLEADKPALLQRVSELAHNEHVYIDATVGVPFERNESYLFGPDGAQLWHYRKNHPVPGLEPVAPFANAVPVVQTPLGRLSNIICYDGDFPALTRVAADIMLLPGWDWPAMGYVHTMRMARLRAIENGYALVRVDFLGVSAAFDQYGRTLAMQETLAGQSHTMMVDVPSAQTPTLYAKIGDVFAWLSLALALGLIGIAILRPVKR